MAKDDFKNLGFAEESSATAQPEAHQKTETSAPKERGVKGELRW